MEGFTVNRFEDITFSVGATHLVGPPKLQGELVKSSTSLEEALHSLATFICQFSENQQLPSMVVHVNVRGFTVFQMALGYVDAFKKVRASPTTKWRIASITKTLTACLAGRLVDQGKITFDGSIETYLSPEIFPPKYWKGEKAKIRVGQLLNHTAGVHETDCVQFTDYEDYGEEYNRTKQFDKFKYEPINFLPGTDFLYSNYAYQIVGKIVEQEEGRPFKSVMSSFIAYIGLSNTAVETPELLKDSQVVYFPNESSVLEETLTMLQFDTKFVQNECAAVGLQSTASDLAQFGSRIIDTVKGRSNALLSSKTIREMLKRRDNTPYGYGWHLFDANKNSRLGAFIGHSGNLIGASSLVLMYLNEEISIAFTTNKGDVPNLHTLGILLAEGIFQFVQ